MKVYRGDIWLLYSHAICIPINLDGVMGAGLAKQARHRHPIESDYDIQLRRRGRVEARYVPTPLTIPETEGNGKLPPPLPVLPCRGLLFLPTKVRWRERASLNLITNSLRDVKQIVEHYNRIRRNNIPFQIAMPRIGCGLGRLNWQEEVLPLVWRELDLVEEFVTLVDHTSVVVDSSSTSPNLLQ